MNESIGVVVPTYNCRAYLSDCLESLLGQSLKPDQIVICDDCSQDGTQEVILKYQRDYPDLIDCVLHEKNNGIVYNFNSGLKEVMTHYVSIIAGDDFWHTDKLKLEIDALRKSPECRWAYSNSVLVDREGKYIQPFRREYDGAEGDILFEVLTHEMTLRNWLIEKSLLDAIGLFDERFHIFEDWDLKIRLAAEAQVKHVDHNSICYRRHGHGISASPGNVYFENLLKVYKKHLSLIGSLHEERMKIILRKQKKDMLLHLNRYLNSNCNISFASRLRYLLYKISLNFRMGA